MNKFRKYLKDNEMKTMDFASKLNLLYPWLNIADITVKYWASGLRCPSPENAYLISKATKGVLTVEDLILPVNKIAEIESKIQSD